MATLTLTLVAGATNQKVLTFSGSDATRILTAFQNQVQADGQAPDFLAWMGLQIKRQLSQMVVQSELVQPTPPAIT